MKRKNILILAFLYFVFTMPLCAQIFNFKNHSFSMQVETGAFYGTAYEILYETSNSDAYLNELQLNIKPLWFVGAFFEYAPKEPLANNAMFFNFDFKLGIPSKTGVMEDRSWTDRSNPNKVTSFYSYDNEIAKAFTINSAIGFSVPLAGNFLAKVSFDIMIINNYFEVYYQIWRAINPVFGIEWHRNMFVFKSAVSVNTKVFGSAGYFGDRYNTEKGVLIEPKSSFFYNISDHFSVGVSFAYTSIDSRGDVTRKKYLLPDEEISNGGGAKYKAFTGELMFKITF